MSETLFSPSSIPDFLLDLEYKGPSFEGVMEINALKNEIAGLEDVIRIVTQVLSKQKRVDFNYTDIQIFVEAFEKGSFRKKVRLAIKGIDKHPGLISVGMLIIMILQTILQYKASQLKNLSPNLIAEIRDQVKVELLKDDKFLKSIANVVGPLEKSGDSLYCAAPEAKGVLIKYEDKKEFVALAGDAEPEIEVNGDQFEILQGRINRVDLDARVRHLGLKVNNEGVTIPATLAENLRGTADMHTLLGQLIELEGTTTYQKGSRTHIYITKYKIIQQGRLFEE